MEFDVSLDLRTGWIIVLSATVLIILLWRIGKRKCHDLEDWITDGKSTIATFCRKWL